MFSTTKTFSTILISSTLLLGCSYESNIQEEIIPEVELLLNEMSIEEKVGQTAQVTLDVLTVGPNAFVSDEPITMDKNLLKEAICTYHIGSILNTANNRAMPTKKWFELISDIQKEVSKTKHSIPVLYGVDAIHGPNYTEGATLTLQQIALGATWNTKLAYELASASAYETKASSIPWTFAPVLDLGSDPRWPRLWETYGEDPLLCSRMGEAQIKGFQKDKLSGKGNVAACMKHFLGYSASKSGKDRTPGELSETSLREYHLPSFEAAINAGAASVMINSGLINGVPIHSNKDLITKLLKQELGFKGLVVTDWADIENLHNRDKIAIDHKEAIKLAFNAGVDMSMIPYDYKRYCTLLTELVKENEVSEERLNDAVRRILNLKYKLGLFEESVFVDSSYPKFGSKEFENLGYEAAGEAITLLKNSNEILPLSKDTRILVTGPNANSMRTLNGGWSYSWQGEKAEEFTSKYNTILEAMQKKFGHKNITYVPGVEYDMNATYDVDRAVDIEGAVRAAHGVDAIVLCLGENSYTEKMGDLHDLSISENQEALALALAQTGKPIILVLNEGRPRVISNFEPKMAAVVQTYLGGNYMGDALASVLVGEVNPSGKLPYTYPLKSNSLVVYNHKPSEESKTPEGMYNYGGGFFPQYEFGYGLSYTTFDYKDLSVSEDKFKGDDEIEVMVTVTNVGDREGKEVVQLYSYDHYATITPDVKRLRAFEKIHLEPNESQNVIFKISAKDLSFIDAQGQRVTEPGKFTLMIGPLHQDVEYVQKTNSYY